MRNIYFLTTGGTIEKTYDETMGKLSNQDTMLQSEILSKLRLPDCHIYIKPVMCKDSLDMTERDRMIIYQSIKNFEDEADVIILVHGTDTLIDTSKTCIQKCSEEGKIKIPVIFTGAMIPMGFNRTDAHQNIIESIMCSQFLGPGFHLCFHGQVFELPFARKNIKARTFEKLPS